MSANNYIKIEEILSNKFRVAEKDYESDLDIHHLGDFDFIRLAIEKAENYINNLDFEVEYGIRFSMLNVITSKVKILILGMLKRKIRSWKRDVYIQQERFGGAD